MERSKEGRIRETGQGQSEKLERKTEREKRKKKG